MKYPIAKATEITHCDSQLESRGKCDAYHTGLGAALGQLTIDGWNSIADGSRFINSSEQKKC